MDVHKGAEGPSYAREIFKVVNDNVMIVRPFKASSSVSVTSPNYLIGKYADLDQEVQKALARNRRKSFKAPTVAHINTGTLS